MLSSDALCHTFDAEADGYVRGEGVGVLVLKRLCDAQADGDRILAVIRGSAVNHDGPSNGLTAPNGLAQQAVIRQALADAGVTPDQIDYVEAHGTGTSLGDPIEVGALGAVFADRDKERPLLIGSVKTNIGHLEAAAGIAGVIKVILSMQHQQLPPHLHLKRPNPHIPWDELPIQVPTELTPWPRGERKRIAGVSSFGFSGTNAHVILEEAPEQEHKQAEVDRSVHVLTLSAKTEPALEELTERFTDDLADREPDQWPDVCYTAGVGRAHFEHRRCVVAATAEEAQQTLAQARSGQQSANLYQGKSQGNAPKVAFLFSGQGVTLQNAGRQLIETQPTFRGALQACDEILAPIWNVSLLEVLYPASETESSLLTEARYLQPALFSFQYALTELWRSWGVIPSIVMGHSLGEYAAALSAGVMDLQTGLSLVAERGRLIGQLQQRGAMAAVRASESQVLSLLSALPKVSIAAINGPEQTVISGAERDVESALTALQRKGLAGQRLAVTDGFHSAEMDDVLEPLAEHCRSLSFSPASLAMVENLSGQRVDRDHVLDGDHWSRHLRQPVRFLDGMRTLATEEVDVLMEIGPGTTLLALGQQCWEDSGESPQWLPSLGRGEDWRCLLGSLAQLHVEGVPVDWQGFDRDYPRQKLSLPTYPFQRQRYWIEEEEPETPASSTDRTTGHPLLGRMRRSAGKEIVFENEFRVDRPSFLTDHRVFGSVVFPATGYLEMALAAGAAVEDSCQWMLQDVTIERPLELEDEETIHIQLVLSPGQEDTDQRGAYSFRICHWSGDKDDVQEGMWVVHSTGTLARTSGAESRTESELIDALRQRCGQTLGVDRHYELLDQRGLNYGSSFRAVESLWHDGATDALGELRLPQPLITQSIDYQLHPVLLDASLQVLAAPLSGSSLSEAYLPVGLERLRVYRAAGLGGWASATLRKEDPGDDATILADVTLLSPEGGLVAELEGLRLQRHRGGPERFERIKDWFYEVQWRSQSLGSASEQLLDPDSVVESCRRQGPPQVERLQEYWRQLDRLEELSVPCILGALEELGIRPSRGDSFSLSRLITSLGVDGSRERLFGRLFEILADAGVLVRGPREEEWVWNETLDASKHQAEIVWLKGSEAEGFAEAGLLRRCLEGLPSVLRGECDPLTLLFPEDGQSTAAQVYSDSPGARRANAQLAEAVSAAVTRLGAGQRLRVLEIGAGTGSATEKILPQLPEDCDYCFTDVSASFLTAAATRFGSSPGHFDTRRLDIERDPQGQGFEPEGFDLIIAGNVLHATKDLKQTLAHVGSLLSPGGLLLMLEVVRPERWLDLTFGLTDGWWRFDDAPLRVSHPLLSIDRWQSLLQEEGFGQSGYVLADGDTPEQARQAVFVCTKEAQESESTVEKDLQGQWLILADRAGVGRSLAAGIDKLGGHCTLAFTATDDVQSNDEFQLSPDDKPGFDRVLQDLGRKGDLRGVISLWALDSPAVDELNSDILMEASHRLCGGVLHTVQSLSRLSATPGFWLVTRDSQPVDGSTALSGLSQSPLWGLGKVIALEHPELGCVRVDLDSDASADQSAEQLLREILHRDGEDQVAFRKDERYVQRLARLITQGENEKRGTSFSSHATYLIAGGSRGLGLATARWMQRHGARTIAVVGRSSPGHDFRDALASANDAKHIHFYSTDITKSSELKRTLQEIRQQLPEIKGVIQSAGVLEDAVLLNQSPELFRKVLGPKLAGTWNMFEELKDAQLDHFLLYSSIASVTGSPGQSNHAAANAFLDAFSHYTSGLGYPSISINWGPWGEIGTLGRRGHRRIPLRNMKAMSPDDGLCALGECINQVTTQIMVASAKWDEVNDPGLTRFLCNIRDTLGTSRDPAIELPRRFQTMTEMDRQSYVLAFVQKHACGVLGLHQEQVDTEVGFFDMGMDSLTAIEFRNRLQKGMGIALPATIALDYPNIVSVANLIVQLLTQDSGTQVPSSWASPIPSPPIAERTLSTMLETELVELIEEKVSINCFTSRVIYFSVFNEIEDGSVIRT